MFFSPLKPDFKWRWYSIFLAFWCCCRTNYIAIMLLMLLHNVAATQKDTWWCIIKEQKGKVIWIWMSKDCDECEPIEIVLQVPTTAKGLHVSHLTFVPQGTCSAPCLLRGLWRFGKSCMNHVETAKDISRTYQGQHIYLKQPTQLSSHGTNNLYGKDSNLGVKFLSYQFTNFSLASPNWY